MVSLVSLVFALLPPVIFGIMLVLATRRAFERTVDDHHWVTLTPWRNFWKFMAKETRWLLIGLACYVVLMTALRLIFGEADSTMFDYVFFALVLSLPITLLLFQFAMLLFLVPRTANRVALGVVSIPLPFFVVVALALVTEAILPSSMTSIRTGNENGLSAFSLQPAYSFLYGVFFIIGMIWWSQFIRGERWFGRQ